MFCVYRIVVHIFFFYYYSNEINKCSSDHKRAIAEPALGWMSIFYTTKQQQQQKSAMKNEQEQRIYVGKLIGVEWIKRRKSAR